MNTYPFIVRSELGGCLLTPRSELFAGLVRFGTFR